MKKLPEKTLFSPVRFVCPMAYLMDLCFALEFSFKPGNLQIICDGRCWKVAIPYCQQCAKAEHVLYIQGTKRLATGDRCWGASASRELEADGWLWDAFLRPPRCWRYGGSCWRCLSAGCPHGSTELLPSGKRSSFPTGLRHRGSVLRLHCPCVSINLHVYYLTGGAGNCQVGARGREPAEVTPGGGRRGGPGMPPRRRAGRAGAPGKC